MTPLSRFALLAVALLIGGCMSPPEYRSERLSPEQHARDSAACERDVDQASAGMCERMQLFDSCMRSKGYNRVIGTGSWGLCHP